MVRLPQRFVLLACLAGMAVVKAYPNVSVSNMTSFESLNNELDLPLSPESPLPLDIASVEKDDLPSDPDIKEEVSQVQEPRSESFTPEDTNLHVPSPTTATVTNGQGEAMAQEQAIVLHPAGARTITSTRTSTHVLPATTTVPPEPISTVVIHAVHTVTVTPSPISAPPSVIVNIVSSIVTATETAIAPPPSPESPLEPLYVPLPSSLAPNVEPLPSPVLANEVAPADELSLPITSGEQEPAAEKDTTIRTSGVLRDAITLKDLQKMFQDQLQKFREELQPSQTSSYSAPPPSSSPDQPPPVAEDSVIASPVEAVPNTPQRKSGNMDFGTELGVPDTELDRIISEVLPSVDIETKNSVRRVLNSILNNDDSKLLKPVLFDTPEIHEPQLTENTLSTVGMPLPQEDALPWMRPSLSVSSKTGANPDGSEAVGTAGLTDKDQSQVEKYFSLLNLGRLKGLPEDAVHDLLDFLRADDKHQFVDDFRQRPFLKKIGLDVTSTPESGAPATSDRPSTFVPNSDAREIDKDASQITDFDALEQQVDQYLLEHPVDLERLNESNDTDLQELENMRDTSEESDADEDDEVVESSGVLKEGLKRVTKSPTGADLKNDSKPAKSSESIGKSTKENGNNQNDYSLLDGTRFTSKFGKKPKLKKISPEGDEEDIEFYDPEDDLFPKQGSQDASKSNKSGKVLSNNHNNEDERSREQLRKTSKSLKNDISFEPQAVNSTTVSKSSNPSESNTTKPLTGSHGSPHDKFTDIVKTTKPKEQDQKMKTPSSLELYLDKVKKNPSSLFLKNDPTMGTKSIANGDEDGAIVMKDKNKGSKKVGESGFFGFTSDASGSSKTSFFSSNIVSTLVVVLAVCVILV